MVADSHWSCTSSAIIVTPPCRLKSSQTHCSPLSEYSSYGAAPQNSGSWFGIELYPITL